MADSIHSKYIINRITYLPSSTHIFIPIISIMTLTAIIELKLDIIFTFKKNSCGLISYVSIFD